MPPRSAAPQQTYCSRHSSLGQDWRLESAVQHVDNSLCVRVYQHENDSGGAVFEFFRQLGENP